MIIKMAKPLDPDARRAALALLTRGLIRPHEAAEMAGVSLQAVNYWCRRAGVDWERVRQRRLTDAWRKELQRGPRLVEEQKPATRCASGARGAARSGV